MNLSQQQKRQLKLEIQHIFDSGANELRIFEMVQTFIEKRFPSPPDTVRSAEIELPSKNEINENAAQCFDGYTFIKGANFVINYIKNQS